MKIIGIGILDDAKRLHPIAGSQIDIWRDYVEGATWKTPHDLKAQFGSADPIRDKLVVFNIKGNDFRLIAKVDYQTQVVIVKHFFTHKEYDKWILKRR